MKLKKTHLLLLIIPLLSFSLHKMYVSLTDIEYKKEAQSVQIIINVFMDDIEQVLNKKNGINLQLTTKNELANNDVYFKDYLKEHVQITINNTLQKMTYIGKEYDRDVIYFYLEIPNITALHTIEVNNTLLVDYFPRQQNMVKVTIGKQRKSLLLTKENDKALLKF